MDSSDRHRLANGAIAAKVCGAGGGGCIAFFCEDGRSADVEAALAAEDGAEVLELEDQHGRAHQGFIAKFDGSTLKMRPHVPRSDIFVTNRVRSGVFSSNRQFL